MTLVAPERGSALPRGGGAGVQGETRTVRRRRRQSAEESQLGTVTSPKVLRGERKLAEGEALESLDADPRAEARANRRGRSAVLRLAGGAIAAGVAVSSVTAQDTVTSVLGWTVQSNPVGYWAAYAIDPMLGALLFGVLALQALASTRGVEPSERAGRVFRRVEFVLFALVAALNAGPALGHLVTDFSGTAAMTLIIHLIGPVLVGLGVYAVPHMLSVLSAISRATAARNERPEEQTEQTDTASSLVDPSAEVPEKWRGDVSAVLCAIDNGEMSPDPSGAEIHRLVGGDAAKKAPLRDAVRGYRPTVPGGNE